MTTHDKRTNGAYFNHSAHNVRMPGTGSPPSAVITRQATREELDELARRLGSQAITRDQYLDARLAGESRRAIAERYGYTAAGLAGAVNRWGLLEAGAEQRAMRERAGVTLPPDVRTTREDGAGAAQTHEAAQVVSQDTIDTSERLSDAHAVTQEEREIMFAIDVAPEVARKIAELKGAQVNMEESEERQEACVVIRIPLQRPDQVDENLSPAETRKLAYKAANDLQRVVDTVVNNLKVWTGSATVEQVQAWVDKAVGE